MKIKLHFNKIATSQGKDTVWSAHTYQDCNGSKEVEIIHNGVVIGMTVFNKHGKQPRAHIQFNGDVVRTGNKSQIVIE